MMLECNYVSWDQHITRETENLSPLLGLSTETAGQDVYVHVMFLCTCVRQACVCVTAKSLWIQGSARQDSRTMLLELPVDGCGVLHLYSQHLGS